MGRMGHGSSRAAMIYLHSTSERDRANADGLGALISDEMNQEGGEQPGEESDSG